MKKEFVHLHTHTDYSMLDGAAKIGNLMEEVKRLGMKSVAITDHGNMHGAYQFYKEAKKREIKPILGIEAYVAPRDRFYKESVKWGNENTASEDDVSGRGLYTHLTLLAYNQQGVSNLLRLSTLAYEEGLASRYPRIDYEILSQYSKGLIATTSCPSGEVQTRLRLFQQEEAYKAIDKNIQIFGKDNYYLELMNHGIKLEDSLKDQLYDIAKKFDLKPLVTNDSHYIKKEDNKIHDIMLAIQTRKTIYDEKRFKFDGEEYYLKSPEEMYALEDTELWQEGCKNTYKLAEQVDTSGIFLHKDLMPKFPDDEKILREKCEANFYKRLKNLDEEKLYRERLNYELEVIAKMGFSSYFIIVSKIIELAFDLKILRGPGRGSVSGSLIAYLLNITDIDPIKHNLIFERFLNPHRVSMPDIDLDIDDHEREKLIEAITQNWGKNNVANVATFMIIKARSAIRDVTRTLNYPVSKANDIVKLLPEPIMGRTAPLTAIYSKDEERYNECEAVRELCERDLEAKKIVDYSIELEGMVRQVGIHAAALILSKDPIYNSIPLYKKVADKRSTTQFDYYSCEELGALKIDLLGLSNLSIIKDTFKLINKEEEVFNLANFNYSDPATYKLLSEGKTLGIFQLDNVKVQELLRMVKPNSLQDIAAIIALYRPGPMGDNAHMNYAYRKNGEQNIDYIDDELEKATKEILEPTYGLLVYQEQVQKIAQTVAGYSAARADTLRRAMGKKDRELLREEALYFKKNMLEQGYSERVFEKLWKILLPFSSYAFNKAHAIGYACISYITAYLKTHYTAFFMMAVMKNIELQEKRNLYREDNEKNFNIKLLPPNINTSDITYTVNKDGHIVYGFDNIKGFSINIAEHIVEIRKDGQYKSVFDLICRLYTFQQKNNTGSLITPKSLEILETIGVFKDIPLYSGAKVDISALYAPVYTASGKAKAKTLIEIIFTFLKDLNKRNKSANSTNRAILPIYQEQFVKELDEIKLKNDIYSKYRITEKDLIKLSKAQSQTLVSKNEYDLLGHYISDPSIQIIEKYRDVEFSKKLWPVSGFKKKVLEASEEEREKLSNRKHHIYGIVHGIDYAPNKKDFSIKLWLNQDGLECRVPEFIQGGKYRAKKLRELMNLITSGEIINVNTFKINSFYWEENIMRLFREAKESRLPLNDKAMLEAIKEALNHIISPAHRYLSRVIKTPELLLHKVMRCYLRLYTFKDTTYFFIEEIGETCSFEELLNEK